MISGKQWTEAKMRFFLREILEILNYIHQANIIHRDIKPSNLIRRAKDSKIVLIDFGAVKEISTLTYDPSTGEILTSEAIGTQGYMPPEQYTRSRPHPYNDIYAVGMVVIQALTGLSPINLPRDPQTNEIIWDYSTPDRPAPQVSNGFKIILNKMVRFHFRDRYQSAAEVLRDLDSLDVLPGDDFRSLLLKFTRSNLRWLLLGFAVITAASAIALLGDKISLRPINGPPLTLPITSPTISSDSLDGMSSGEKLLVQTSALWSKQRGINEFADKNYSEALKQLKQSWRQDRRDPETLIYMNNALLKAINAEYYTIAIVVPIRRNPDGSILFDKKFPINAEKLWGGQVNTRSALTYDAARTLIKALEMQSEPSREGMQKTLADPNFKAEGATGIIEFDRNTGNRINPPKRVMHIVPCAREIYGVTFVPIEFPTAAAAGLKCD
ncbi:MAG: protein kinase domain-containing protein [Microcoleus sp.]